MLSDIIFGALVDMLIGDRLAKRFGPRSRTGKIVLAAIVVLTLAASIYFGWFYDWPETRSA